MTKDEIGLEAQHILNHLAGNPQFASASTERAVVKSIMLSTSGEAMACGILWDIVARPLGGGVFKLTLAERKLR